MPRCRERLLPLCAPDHRSSSPITVHHSAGHACFIFRGHAQPRRHFAERSEQSGAARAAKAVLAEKKGAAECGASAAAGAQQVRVYERERRESRQCRAILDAQSIMRERARRRKRDAFEIERMARRKKVLMRDERDAKSASLMPASRRAA